MQSKDKFYEVLEDLFIGQKVKGVGGFINLMSIKQNFYNHNKTNLETLINQECGNNDDFLAEVYDKLYSFFHIYFSISGSIYYNYTPYFYKIYTKAYEQVKSNRVDTELFYKTNMLYYVKSDTVFKDLEVEIKDDKTYKFNFDTSNLHILSTGEKKDLIYTLSKNQNKSVINLEVTYKKGKSTTKFKDITKQTGIKEHILKEAIRIFEKQSSVDFFINKNAKAFLNQQLDIWIYQYMFVNDSDFSDERFKQIQSFKKIAKFIIDFTSQFENELLKIWLKPKFVLNSNIVVTLDKLKEKNFDISKLENHKNFKAQQDEWQKLGINQSDGLLENEFLPFDTKYFPEYKGEIESLFDEMDGTLVKSDNLQALNSMQNRYERERERESKVDLIYIDPPFNTKNDFAYIDKFQDSTWLTIMHNRLELAKKFLSDKGSIYLHLDHNANYYGRILLNQIFGKENFVNEIVWSYKSFVGQTARYYPRKHDTLLFYAKNPDSFIFHLERQNIDIENMSDFKNWGKYIVNGNEIRGDYYPKDVRFERNVNKWRRKNPSKNPGKNDVLYIFQSQPLNDAWNDINYLDPKNKTERIQSEVNLTQKPEALLERIIKASSNQKSIVMDFFAGSGTTLAVAQKLGRKWLGVEMGEHFYKVIIPRLKKILSGFQSGISKNVSYKGGGVFKYYELESYEQVLKTAVYFDTPNEYLKLGGKDAFLFDERLSDCVNIDDEITLDLTKLYDAKIDLKESLFNHRGKKVKEISNNKVIYEDESSESLISAFKEFLIW